jgi:hypothetical protein
MHSVHFLATFYPILNIPKISYILHLINIRLFLFVLSDLEFHSEWLSMGNGENLFTIFLEYTEK